MGPKDTIKTDEMRLRGERLREVVDVIGSRQVAEDSGVPYTTLRGYVAGGDMKLSVLASVARACGVSIDWIAYGKEEHAPASAGLLPDHGLVDLDRLSTRFGISPSELVSFAVVGDAMEPTIRAGDTLVAHRLASGVIAPAIYAVEIDGHLAARRLEQRVDGTLVIGADNARYAAQVLAPGADRPIGIIGPVIWLSGPIRN